ncbi:hypothetical protein NMX13_03655 [Dickeya zeae]|nr:hypothetical protein NMX13_03655 [Dickeya zeae]
MTDLPDPNDMLVSAQNNLLFFLKTLYLHFSPDWEQNYLPPIDETSEQRIKRQIKEKESFLQSGLVILFNSAEIYIKSLIASENVFFLLKDIKDASRSKSFFDCQTIDAVDLNLIYEGISSKKIPDTFKETYEYLRKERNKVIHLGKSNNIEITNYFIKSFIVLSKEIYRKPLIDMTNILFDSKNLSSEEIESSKKNYASAIIDIFKEFFPINKIIKEIYKLDNEPRRWDRCIKCNIPDTTLAVISNKKSLCLACGFSNGV